MRSFGQNKVRIGKWVINAYELPNSKLWMVRKLYCLYYLVIIGVPNFTTIADNPLLLFDPPSWSLLGVLPSHFPNSWFLASITIGSYLAFVLLFFGIKVRWTSWVIAFLFLIGFNYSYSFGKIGHSIFAVLFPFFMGIKGWDKSDSSANNWAITFLGFAFVFAMFTAGFQKLLGGWLDLSSHAAQYHFMIGYHYRGHQAFLANLGLNMPTLVWELMDWLVVIFEMGFVLLFFFPKLFKKWMVLGLLFHLLNLLVLNIPFTSVLPVYFIFLSIYYRSSSKLSFIWKVVGVIMVIGFTIMAYKVAYRNEVYELIFAPSPLKLIFYSIGFNPKLWAVFFAYLLTIGLLSMGFVTNK